MTNADPVAQSGETTEKTETFTDRAAVEAFCGRIMTTMDDLIALLETETEMVRAGKLLEAGDLQPKKSDLANRYVEAMNVARANTVSLGRLAPDIIEAMQRRHVEFRALLQINMAVLATAREASEDILKTVAEAVGNKETASSYGRSGDLRPQTERTASGIACDRNL